MVGIKDFGMPSCCMNCEMFDGEYGNCDIIGDTQDFEYQWNENRPFDCPLVEAIPKSDYEARLKADMVAMLEELKSEFEEKIQEYEARSKEHINATYEASMCGRMLGYCGANETIQEKIDALRGENNGNK